MDRLQKNVILGLTLYLISLMLIIMLSICNIEVFLFIESKIRMFVLSLSIIFILVQFIIILYNDYLTRKILTKEEYELYTNTSESDPIIAVKREKITNKVNNYLHKKGNFNNCNL